MVFALMGGELQEATWEATTGTLANETLALTDAGVDTTVADLRDIALDDVVLTNATGGEVIPANNYTVLGGTVTTLGSSLYNGTDGNISASYTYNADTTASDVINDTTSGISGVTDWFPIIIVITAMVVLILLTVIIITAIRGSGLVASA